MLSAIAARKAALSQSTITTPKTPQNGDSDRAISQAPSQTTSSSKRKSRTSEVNATSTKRSKVKETKAQKSDKAKSGKSKGRGKKGAITTTERYFRTTVGPEDAFTQGADVIAVDSSSDSESELDFQTQDQDTVVLSSADVSDSDGEDDAAHSMEVDASPVNLSTLFPHTAASAPKQWTADLPLSTFKPVDGENVFRLTSAEVSDLALPPAPSSSSTHLPASSIILLPPHESICILGTCSITVLHGSISILGTSLYPSTESHRIYAPKSSPLPIIRCAFGKGVESLSVLSAVKLPPRVAIDEDVARHGAVLLLQELKTGVEGLGKICRPFYSAFQPSKWQGDADSLNLPGVSLVHKHLSDITPFVLPHSWTSALEKVASTSTEVCNVYLVKGPKNTGKSTFARTLLNRLLQTYERVAFLECDLGQSEFTPGGMVALNVISRPVFGPPFTHLTLPVAAHFIGSTTPRSSPSHYLEAIQALLQLYRLEIQTPSDERLARAESEDHIHPAHKISHIIPLVVNTMGWSKGLGSDLTKKIEEWAIPTDVYNFEATEAYPDLRGGVSSGASTPLPIRRHKHGFGAFHQGSMDVDDFGVQRVDSDSLRTFTLDGIPPLETTPFTAADHRTLNLISYFHCVFPAIQASSSHQTMMLANTSLPLVEDLSLGQLTADSWNTDIPLVAVPPYEVDAGQALDRLVLTGSGSEDVVDAEIGRVLNGAVVGLVSCTEGAFAHWFQDEEGQSRQHLAPGDIGARGGGRKLPYTQHCPAPQPTNATCIGLGLVRGVHPRYIDDTGAPGATGDAEAEQNQTQADLQLLTPVPPTLLSTTKVFVKGEMELPIWGMLDFRAWESADDAGGNETAEVVEMEQGKTPFLQWGKNVSGAVGSEKKRVRRNLMRRGQM